MVLDALSFDNLNSLDGSSHGACFSSVSKTGHTDNIVNSQLRPLIHSVGNTRTSPPPVLNNSRNVNPIPLKKPMKPLKVGGEFGVELEVTWGDGKGVEIETHFKGDVHDDKGNYVKVDYSRNDDGDNNVKISAGHEEKSE